MAKMAKARVLSAKAKAKVASKPSVAKKPALTVKKAAKPSVATKVTAAAPAPVDASAGNKKVSQKLLETIERRKKAQQQGGKEQRPMGFARGRRGRRPKSMSDYTPSTQDEDSYVLESDYEGLEYDTGIRLKDSKDDLGFSLDRAEEFDEELNFDH